MSKIGLETFLVKKRGRRLKCICGYEWVYCGKSELYAHCPKCRSTVTINPKRQRPQHKQQLQQIDSGSDQLVSDQSVAAVEN
jgi:hypothetical protein